MAKFKITYPDGLEVIEEAATPYQAAINTIQGDISFIGQLHGSTSIHNVPKLFITNLDTYKSEQIDGELIVGLIYLSNQCNLPEFDSDEAWEKEGEA